MVDGGPMSEFKFACPFCGQHITAASSSSGTHLDCPTCFQKLVVPQSPSTNDSKLILSAAKADRRRPSTVAAGLEPLRRSRSWASLVVTVLLCVLACAAAGVLYVSRAKIIGLLGLHTRPPEPAPTNALAVPVPPPVWDLDPAKAVLRDAPAAGQIHSKSFQCDRSTLAGGVLSLRQGQTWPPDLGVDILLSAQRAEQLAGKNIIIAPGNRSVVFKVILRWKDEGGQPREEAILAGYALVLSFGQPANGRMTGNVSVCLPDAAKSVVAGTFDAEVIRPHPAAR